MLRSMFSAVSGLRSHQTMMDVVGNNVANVNTSGFKSSRVTFQETLTQVVRGATGAGGAQGGVNPMQLGLGAKTGAVDGVFTQGATQVTGRATDLAIQGDGFFAVQDPTGNILYTRSGAFTFDESGNLVTVSGERVLGFDDPTQTTGTTADLVALTVDFATHGDFAVGADGILSGRNLATGVIEDLARITVTRFANEGGLERVGNGLYQPTVNSGDPDAGTGAPGLDGRGGLQSGTLEMSNVDLAQEFTNLILAQRGFQANARTITASDEILQDLVNLKR